MNSTIQKKLKIFQRYNRNSHYKNTCNLYSTTPDKKADLIMENRKSKLRTRKKINKYNLFLRLRSQMQMKLPKRPWAKRKKRRRKRRTQRFRKCHKRRLRPCKNRKLLNNSYANKNMKKCYRCSEKRKNKSIKIRWRLNRKETRWLSLKQKRQESVRWK